MRVGLISTLATRVRARGAGSIEGLVWSLAHEMTALGHEVTVFAAAGSQVPGRLVETARGLYGENGMPGDYQRCESVHAAAAIAASASLDVLHSHAYLTAVPMQRWSPVPMLHTLHVQAYDDDAAIVRLHPGTVVTSLSKHQWAEFPDVEPVAVIPHGVDPNVFPMGEGGGGYLCFLGRFLPEKGPRAAIRVAEQLGLPLVLAGPANDYFREVIEPLVNGEEVTYAGPVGGDERTSLLGNATAMLYPITVGEPFGMVLIEAMMCGTPVVATEVGAVPEIVREGRSGAMANGDVSALAAATQRALTIPREVVRAEAESRFTARRMAQDYLDAYAAVLKESR